MYDGDPDSPTGSTDVATNDADHADTTCLSGDLKIESDIPLPPQKRYAHHGKRRRRFTEELFRCQYIDKISRSDLVCNSLLWKNRPDELRWHLREHLSVAQIEEMSDDDVRNWYTQAKRIFLAGIPEDEMDNEEDESTEEDEE